MENKAFEYYLISNPEMQEKNRQLKEKNLTVSGLEDTIRGCIDSYITDRRMFRQTIQLFETVNKMMEEAVKPAVGKNENKIFVFTDNLSRRIPIIATNDHTAWGKLYSLVDQGIIPNIQYALKGKLPNE